VYVAGGGYSSSLSIINLDADAGSLTLRLVGDDGVPIGASRTLSIERYGKVLLDDPQLFGPLSDEEMRTGYLEIRSSGVRLAGSISISDPGLRSFAAVLPLVRTSRRERSSTTSRRTGSSTPA